MKGLNNFEIIMSFKFLTWIFQLPTRKKLPQLGNPTGKFSSTTYNGHSHHQEEINEHTTNLYFIEVLVVFTLEQPTQTYQLVTSITLTTEFTFFCSSTRTTRTVTTDVREQTITFSPVSQWSHDDLVTCAHSICLRPTEKDGSS